MNVFLFNWRNLFAKSKKIVSFLSFRKISLMEKNNKSKLFINGDKLRKAFTSKTIYDSLFTIFKNSKKSLVTNEGLSFHSSYFFNDLPQNNIFYDYLFNFSLFNRKEELIFVSHLFNSPFFSSFNSFYDFFSKNNFKEIPLKKFNSSILKDKNFINVLKERKSIRYFSSKSISINVFSAFLYLTFSKKIRNNRYPSAGGLYKIEPILIIKNIDKLKSGFYFYNKKNHALVPITICDIKIDEIMARSKNEFENFSFAVVYAFDSLLPYIKYGLSSLVFNSIEVGAITELLQLISIFLDIGFCDIGGFNKNYIENKIGINESFYIHIIHMTIFGAL